MKNLLLCLLLALAFGFSLEAQNAWTAQNSGLSVTLVSVHFNDTQNGWAAGVGGAIVATTDGGQNWTQQESGVDVTLRQVIFVNNAVGWAAGDDAILKTTDGGNTWSRIYTTEEYHTLNTIHFTDQNTGWAAGGDLEAVYLIKTLDGGSTWMEYSDSVNYWSPWVNGSDGTIFDILFLNEDVGWFIGTDATDAASWMTTDGGSTWDEMFFGVTCPKYGIDFVDGQHGWTAGKYNFKSTDNGDDWYQRDTGFEESYGYDVDFVTTEIGWIVGDEGKIAKSTDGGDNWQAQSSGTSSRLYSIHMHDENLGWVVGRDGTILKYSASSTSSSDLNSSEHTRFEIFPNPVSSRLSIETEIAFTEVNILDVKGSLVKRVVGNNRAIQVSDLPGGIYFLELIADEFSAVQKFVKH